MIREAEHEKLRELVRRWLRNSTTSFREAVLPLFIEATAQAFRAIEREDAAAVIEDEMLAGGLEPAKERFGGPWNVLPTKMPSHGVSAYDGKRSK